MTETNRDNKYMTNDTNNGQHVLLIDETNVKSNNKSYVDNYKNLNDYDLEKNMKNTNQKSKFYLNDCLMMILAVIIVLLFLITLALTIFSFVHCYSKLNYYKKIADEYAINTTVRSILTTTNGNTSSSSDPQNNQNSNMDSNATLALGAGRAKSIENEMVLADED